MYIFEGFFHIIGLYIHGTKGFANHRIGNFLETNKINVFETIIDCSLKKLLSKMGNILQSHNRQTGFKNIKSSKIPVLHQELLLHNEKVLGKIQISRYAVLKLLKFVPFNFKIYQATKDLSDAILKINEC